MQHAPIPAATLIILRDLEADAPELLMIERGAGMAFAAGALVFPGGRVDEGDREVASSPMLLTAPPHADIDDASARVAAIRETIEEVGIAIGLDPIPDEAAIARLRAGLLEGGSFPALLAAAGCRLDTDRLTLFAHWCPRHRAHRNFDTRFYLASAPDRSEPVPDGGESVHALWIQAERALADAAAGRHHVIFPTQRNLERLAASASFAEALADAARHPARMIEPRIEERDGGRWLCIPEGHGYPVTSAPLASAKRG